MDINDTNATIKSLKHYAKNKRVYNLTVGNVHTYYVGLGGVLGHNAPHCIRTMRISNLPRDLQDAFYDTLSYINKALKPDWLAKGRGPKWGSTYGNNDKRLPITTDKGINITYKEYDIKNVRGGDNAGVDRIVTGSDGKKYYTGTHYGQNDGIDFLEIK